jgi:hypothetical protein
MNKVIAEVHGVFEQGSVELRQAVMGKKKREFTRRKETAPGTWKAQLGKLISLRKQDQDWHFESPFHLAHLAIDVLTKGDSGLLWIDPVVIQPAEDLQVPKHDVNLLSPFGMTFVRISPELLQIDDQNHATTVLGNQPMGLECIVESDTSLRNPKRKGEELPWGIDKRDLALTKADSPADDGVWSRPVCLAIGLFDLVEEGRVESFKGIEELGLPAACNSDYEEHLVAIPEVLLHRQLAFEAGCSFPSVPAWFWKPYPICLSVVRSNHAKVWSRSLVEGRLDCLGTDPLLVCNLPLINFGSGPTRGVVSFQRICSGTMRIHCRGTILMGCLPFGQTRGGDPIGCRAG